MGERRRLAQFPAHVAGNPQRLARYQVPVASCAMGPVCRYAKIGSFDSPLPHRSISVSSSAGQFRPAAGSTRNRMQIPLLLDRSRSETLTTQLVDQLREAIRRGRIPSGARLPSSRALADELAIARNTATRAYETLVIEGYAETRPASGIFAAAALPVLPAAASVPPPASNAARAPLPLPVVTAPAGIAAPRGSVSFDFSPSAPSASLFPLKTWRRLLQSALSRGGANGLSQVGDPGGLAALRAALSQHLAAARGIVADPVQILVLSGIREGIALASRLFLAPGRQRRRREPDLSRR